MQAGEFARFTGNAEVMAWCRERFKSTLVPDQVAPDGSLPLELARTKPYSYCLFDLDVLGTVCQTLSTASENLWTFTTPDGRGMRKVVAFMVSVPQGQKRMAIQARCRTLGRLPQSPAEPALCRRGLWASQLHRSVEDTEP